LEAWLGKRSVARGALHVHERGVLLRVKAGTPFDGVFGAGENRNNKGLDTGQEAKAGGRNRYVSSRVD